MSVNIISVQQPVFFNDKLTPYHTKYIGRENFLFNLLLKTLAFNSLSNHSKILNH